MTPAPLQTAGLLALAMLGMTADAALALTILRGAEERTVTIAA